MQQFIAQLHPPALAQHQLATGIGIAVVNPYRAAAALLLFRLAVGRQQLAQADGVGLAVAGQLEQAGISAARGGEIEQTARANASSPSVRTAARAAASPAASRTAVTGSRVTRNAGEASESAAASSPEAVMASRQRAGPMTTATTAPPNGRSVCAAQSARASR